MIKRLNDEIDLLLLLPVLTCLVSFFKLLLPAIFTVVANGMPPPHFIPTPSLTIAEIDHTGLGRPSPVLSVFFFCTGIKDESYLFYRQRKGNNSVLTWRAGNQVNFDRYAIEWSVSGKK